MKNYYAHMNLPEPVVPTLEHLRLLKGQIAVVTGASSGIGRAIALSLGRAGPGRVSWSITTRVPRAPRPSSPKSAPQAPAP